MAKALKVSPHCGSQIEGLQEAEEFSYGILIGQLAVEEKEFLIAHLARTPAEEQGEVLLVSALGHFKSVYEK